MILSNTRAIVGLQTKAGFTSTALSGSPQIGANSKTITFPDADVAYSLRAFFANGQPTLALDPTTGLTTGSTAWVAGAAQVETATAAGTASATGTVTTTVTATSSLAGSPISVTTTILDGDTADVWAGKVRASLAENVPITSRFTVSGEGTAIILTRKPGTVLVADNESVNLFASNDETLNIAIAAGATGITPVTTSANTTAGAATSGVLIRDGDGKDFEGVTIPTCLPNAILFDNSGNTTLTVTTDYDNVYEVERFGTVLLAAKFSLIDDSALTISPSTVTPTILTITVIGQSA
jgi:hypothetical protein